MNDKIHLWQGDFIDDNELSLRIANLKELINKALINDFPLNDFLNACDKIGEDLRNKGDYYHELLDLTTKTTKMSSDDINKMFDVLSNFMNKEILIQKMKNEFGTDEPFEIKRINFKHNQFEGLSPLGFLVHIAPSNVFTVSVLSLVEGLLSGNINFLKTSSSDSLLAQHFFSKLIEYDQSGILKDFIIIARFSSKKLELLKSVLQFADAISAWGSEEAIKSISSLAPDGVKVVKWGHKISFAYISQENINNEQELELVASDICLIEQQACSSPQNLYVEISDFDELVKFAERFAIIFDRVSAKFPRIEPEFDFQTEITNVVEVARAEESLGITKVVDTIDKNLHIIVDSRKSLRASPLFRFIWIKSLMADEIIETLYPMRSYLQTVGLSCPLNRLGKLSSLFFKAGLLRINKVGSMLDGYIGEPHDGKFALIEYTKRISINLNNQLLNYSSMNEFRDEPLNDLSQYPVMSKTDFQNLIVDDKYIDLVVKSGGSSGKPTYSYFTWDDYHFQMLNAAYGLYASGLDPSKDSVMNLFAAGNLYGGFISFFSILEFMQAKQYPMGMIDDYKYIAETIIKNNINALISAPSYIVKLFEINSELFSKNRTVKKIFYGGEHFTKSQKNYLIDNFGVEIIRSAAYGSNDAGPIGYQCHCCEGNEHHVMSNLQTIEFLKLHSDEPSEPNEPGRIILTSKKRSGQVIRRYEIGDIGRLISEKCQCGRSDTKFELLGRIGDVFKAGGPFLNYNSFANILDKEFEYSGNCQIILQSKGTSIELVLRIEKSLKVDEKVIYKTLDDNYPELSFSIKELNLILSIEKINPEDFIFIEHSGKLKKIIDRR